MNLKTFFCIFVLMWGHILAGIIVYMMMMIYLTDVWKLDVTRAASTVNIWMGASLAVILPLSLIADTFLGSFCVLLLSILSHTAGQCLLWMSTPPVLAPSYGNCTAYKPECIGPHQKLLFYTALPLIAVGAGGSIISIISFTAEQGEQENDGEVSFGWCCCIGGCTLTLMHFSGVGILIAAAFIQPWVVLFGMSAGFATFSTLVFLTGICSFKYVGPQGSPLTTICRVFLAALSKLIYRVPRNKNQLYEKPGLGLHQTLGLTRGFRCLEKAAIVLPNRPVEQQERNRWRLCSVTEVEQTKAVIRMIPMCLPFVLAIVYAAGFTYFLEQAKHLDRRLGKLKLPVYVLALFYELGKKITSKIYDCFGCCFEGDEDGNPRPPSRAQARYLPPAGVMLALVFAVLCCVTAAKVEARRLDVARSHGLLDKPDEMRVPMSVFWLVPQCMLLGAMEATYMPSFGMYLAYSVPGSYPPVAKCAMLLALTVLGGWIMSSALVVYILKKSTHWFQSTFNHSRLDNDYWVLAALGAVTFAVYAVILVIYCYRDARGEDVREAEGDTENRNMSCCCCL